MSDHTPTLGPYRLDDVVGRGGMATVWRARGPLGPVAVKILTARRARQPAFRRVLRHEIRALARLSHPGIAALLDHGEVTEREARRGLRTGTPWLAQELAVGTLGDHRGVTSWRTLHGWMLEILAALAHAHARGVLHRDLKPQNVLVGADGRLLLTDFGLAHPVEADRPGMFERAAGTPGFMSPEQAEGRWRDFGPWTDLYAVGRLVLALLDRAAAVPRGLGPLLARLFAQEGVDRYRRAADVAHAVRALPTVGGRPLPADWWDAGTDRASSTFALSSVEADAAPPTLSIRVTPAPIVRLPVPDAPPREHRLPAGVTLLGLRQPPLVGRDAEQLRLWSALRRVTGDGTPRAVAIRGPVGVGTSRLAAWLCEATHASGVAAPTAAACRGRARGAALGVLVARVLRGRGLELDALHQRAAGFLAVRGIDDPWEARAIASIVAPALGVAPLVRFADAAERHRVAADLLVREAERRVPLVWLDDADADPDALAFARFLLDRPDPVLVLLSGREVALDHPRVEALDLAQPSADVLTAMLVQGWGLTRALATRLAGHLPHPLHVAWWVERQAARGRLVPTDDGIALAPGASLGDEGIADLGAARLDAVLEARPTSDVAALTLAALLGPEASAEEWLDACASRGLVPRPDLVDVLLAAGLARRDTPEAHWTFAHPFWRDTLVERAGDARRRLELACADALASRADRVGLTRRAGHLAAGGRPLAAVEADLAASYLFFAHGEQGRAEEVLDRSRRVLDDALAPDDHPLRLRILLQQARLRRYSGRLTSARSAAAEVADRAERHGHTLVAAEADVEIAHIDARRESPAEAVDTMRAVRDALPPNAPDDLRASIAYQLGTSATLAGQLDVARAELDTARRLWADMGDRFGATDATWGLARAEIAAGDLRAAREHLDRALAHTRATGSRRALAILENERGDLARLEGRADEALVHFDISLHHARTIGYGSIEVIELNRSLALLALGRHAAARDALGPVVEEFERRGWTLYATGARLARVVAWAGTGQADMATAELASLRPELAALVDADIARLLEDAAARLPPGRAADDARRLALAHWTSLGRPDDADRVRAHLGGGNAMPG